MEPISMTSKLVQNAANAAAKNTNTVMAPASGTALGALGLSSGWRPRHTSSNSNGRGTGTGSRSGNATTDARNQATATVLRVKRKRSEDPLSALHVHIPASQRSRHAVLPGFGMRDGNVNGDGSENGGGIDDAKRVSYSMSLYLQQEQERFRNQELGPVRNTRAPEKLNDQSSAKLGDGEEGAGGRKENQQHQNPKNHDWIHDFEYNHANSSSNNSRTNQDCQPEDPSHSNNQIQKQALRPEPLALASVLGHAQAQASGGRELSYLGPLRRALSLEQQQQRRPSVSSFRAPEKKSNAMTSLGMQREIRKKPFRRVATFKTDVLQKLLDRPSGDEADKSDGCRSLVGSNIGNSPAPRVRPRKISSRTRHWLHNLRFIDIVPVGPFDPDRDKVAGASHCSVFRLRHPAATATTVIPPSEDQVLPRPCLVTPDSIRALPAVRPSEVGNGEGESLLLKRTSWREQNHTNSNAKESGEGMSDDDSYVYDLYAADEVRDSFSSLLPDDVLVVDEMDSSEDVQVLEGPTGVVIADSDSGLIFDSEEHDTDVSIRTSSSASKDYPTTPEDIDSGGYSEDYEVGEFDNTLSNDDTGVLDVFERVNVSRRRKDKPRVVGAGGVGMGMGARVFPSSSRRNKPRRDDVHVHANVHRSDGLSLDMVDDNDSDDDDNDSEDSLEYDDHGGGRRGLGGLGLGIGKQDHKKKKKNGDGDDDDGDEVEDRKLLKLLKERYEKTKTSMNTGGSGANPGSARRPVHSSNNGDANIIKAELASASVSGVDISVGIGGGGQNQTQHRNASCANYVKSDEMGYEEDKESDEDLRCGNDSDGGGGGDLPHTDNKNNNDSRSVNMMCP